MEDQHITPLDILGMKEALKELIEKNLGMNRVQISGGKIARLESLEDLIKRDLAREKDGFPKKIRFRKVLISPGRVINVPFVEEEQLVHGDFEPKNIENKIIQALSPLLYDDGGPDDIDEIIGHGEGEVGDVIGEMPIGGSGSGGEGEGEGGGGTPGPGPGGDGSEDHGFEEEAYETGKKLTEKLKLPNLKDKVKKVPTNEYTYDLTDRHKGSGQVLDKKETLKRIIKTNLVLGRVTKEDLDPTKMLIGPEDRIFRVLSQEKVWKAQAVVFFLRDFSGSMWGEPTKALASLHLMIYAWLLVQFEKRVIPRFIVHDTRAREVTAKEYFTLSSGGGTLIASGYNKINEIVEGEGLEEKYNIYVFQGTDGDDGDDGRRAIPEIQKILRYANRIGVCLFKHPYYGATKTPFEDYIEKSRIAENKKLFRMHTLPPNNITEEKNIETLKALVAQD